MSKQLGNPNFFFSPWPRDRISVHAWPLFLLCSSPLFAVSLPTGRPALVGLHQRRNLPQPRPHATTCIAASWNDGSF